jgi:hypothetical protein
MSGAIFVSIACYRDSECQWTLKDLYQKARQPLQVHVGVCWQVDRDEDRDCFLAECDEWQQNPRVRHHFMHYRDATGPCLARHVAQQLMPAEAEFYFQIDSHMRFVTHWDDVLRRYFDLALRQSAEPVLTAYPIGYELPNQLPPDTSAWTALVPTEFSARDCMLRSAGRNVTSATGGAVHRGAVVAAGMLFCRASLVRRGVVAYDADLPQLFFGEEALLAARLFCAGADVYWPGAHVAYHLWSRAHRPNFRDVVDARRPTQRWASSLRVIRALQMHFALPHAYASAPWASKRRTSESIAIEGVCDDAQAQRLLAALAAECDSLGADEPAIEVARAAIVDDVQLYASGSPTVPQTRTLAEFASATGIDLQRGTVSQSAKDGGNPHIFVDNALALLLQTLALQQQR